MILVLSMIGAGAAAPVSSTVDDVSADSDDVSQSSSGDQSEETTIPSTSEGGDGGDAPTGDVSVDVGDEDIVESIFDSLEPTVDLGSLVEELLDGVDTIDDVDDADDADEDDADEDDADEDDADDADEDDADEDDADDADEDDADDADEDDADDAVDEEAVEQYAHDAVNEERVDAGVDELEFDDELRDIAYAHSEDMAERGYFAHEDPDGNDVSDRYEEAGYECNVNGYVGGENIAQTWYDTPVNTDDRGTVHYEDEQELGEGIVEQWMNSPAHEANLLADQWENQGIGIHITDDDQVYATQNFC
ncbi:CAP domain-containing protein [Natronorubrum daqingense]|nr:CAP domain-containing protein [Natronorubrum daqingense]